MDEQSTDAARELGTQPLERLMAELGLSGHDLVGASGEQLTHKMVAKARRGRRVTPNVKQKILNALNRARPRDPPFRLDELFTYR